jgi:uncharacterized OB-fold protein
MMGVPRFWREIPYRYQMIGTKCSICDNAFFPPRSICPNCRGAGDIQETKLSGRGEVVTYTVVRVAPEGFEKETPYVVAIVKLEEGPRITSQIVDCDLDEIEIGTKVRSVFRKVGEESPSGAIYYSYKFVPA